MPTVGTRLDAHGIRALTAEFIEDPDTWAGRVRRSYGRLMMYRLASTCEKCHAVDAQRARIRRMHALYRRRQP